MSYPGNWVSLTVIITLNRYCLNKSEGDLIVISNIDVIDNIIYNSAF